MDQEQQLLDLLMLRHHHLDGTISMDLTVKNTRSREETTYMLPKILTITTIRDTVLMVVRH